MKRLHWITWLLLALALVGCSASPTATPLPLPATEDGMTNPTLTPSVTLPPEPSPTPVIETVVVSFSLGEANTSEVQAQVNVGDVAQLYARFTSGLYRVIAYEDGRRDTSLSHLDAYDVAEMDLCAALDSPCSLQGQWIPYESEPTFDLTVDWLGPRQFWLTLQFRDAEGNVIPSVWSRGAVEPAPVVQASQTIVGVLDPDTPLETLPSPVQTAAVATQAAFPVGGSVLIEGGRCCAGGVEGETIQIDVEFEASSPFDEVTDMRVRTGGRFWSEAEMSQAEWEPFGPTKSYPFRVVINWVGFYVSVQYRDAQGNLSPVYHDDISVEGHPAPPTLVPSAPTP